MWAIISREIKQIRQDVKTAWSRKYIKTGSTVDLASEVRLSFHKTVLSVSSFIHKHSL